MGSTIFLTKQESAGDSVLEAFLARHASSYLTNDEDMTLKWQMAMRQLPCVNFVIVFDHQ